MIDFPKQKEGYCVIINGVVVHASEAAIDVFCCDPVGKRLTDLFLPEHKQTIRRRKIATLNYLKSNNSYHDYTTTTGIRVAVRSSPCIWMYQNAVLSVGRKLAVQMPLEFFG